MPKLENPILLEDGLAIGSRKTQKGAWWYSRHFHKERKGSDYYALKIPFEQGRASERQAAKAARIKHHEDYLPKINAGQHPSTSLEITQIAKHYSNWIVRCTKENLARIKKNQKPLNKNLSGSFFWDHERSTSALNNLSVLEPFWQSLPTTNLRAIRMRDLNGFTEWAERNTDWSPSTIGYRITTIRDIYRFIQKEYALDVVIPQIKAPPRNLKERKRKPLTEKIYFQMLDYARKNYDRFDLKKNPRQWENKDLAFQFLCFFELISWSGFRPPHKEETNFPKWSDIRKIKVGKPDETWVIRRHSEKNLPAYDALILPQVHGLLNGLHKLYKKRGMKPTYLFEHTGSRGQNYEKGDVIKNFRTRWKFMLEGLGLDAEAGSPQSERFVPYALRAYYITQRLRNGADIYQVSQACGTSPKMVEIIYDDFRTELTAQRLSVGAPEERIYREQYDADGNFKV